MYFEEIDFEAFLCINDTLLQSIIPTVGQRAKFFKKLDNLRKKLNGLQELSSSIEHVKELVLEENNSCSILEPNISEIPPLEENEVIDIKAIYIENISYNLDNNNITLDAIVNEETSKEHNLCDKIVCSSEPPSKKNKKQNAVEAVLNIPGREIFALQIKENYKANTAEKKLIGLSRNFSNKLCFFLINDELNGNASNTISTSRFLQLAEDIVEYFPAETKEVYYIPYKAIKISKKNVKKIAPKGKLYNQYTNLMKELLKGGLRESCKTSSNSISTLDEVFLDDANQASLKWLAKRVELCNKVPLEWKATHQLRMHSLQNSSNEEKHQKIKGNKENPLKNSIVSYFMEFPFLKQPGGLALLELDFDTLYPSKTKSLFTEWEFFSHRLRSIARVEENKSLSDAEIFMLLSSVFNAIGYNSVRVTKKWRANRQEMLHSFICHVKTTDAIEGEVNAIEAKAATEKITVQPFVILVGDDLHHITDSYVHIAGIRFRVSSPKDAVDSIFKAFHALHTSYPIQSECFWLLIQKVIYKFNTKWDNNIPSVQVLISKFLN
ncbi:uncharacterized protein LOC118645222 isoform X2 [Monomorium pharaonis]|uniref:uncharacterized protein LOC118645222 isoform X2 n=1 Tax=Monomorium pharaonis TaxID=307658 RepID=UPI0017467880|nr:uncharacterized protein LOC118645222 isoform X2 [Monomorium pharaonis]